jgi:hypothetical protein
MTITPIETIKEKAKEAAHAGMPKTSNPYPMYSPQGAMWDEFYESELDSFEAQVAGYGMAIGVAA